MYKILNNILEIDDYSLQRLSKSSKLPSEYQQIEYIESTGTQYINTKILSALDLRIECKYSTTIPNKTLLGARTSSSEDCLIFGYFHNSMMYYASYGGESSDVTGNIFNYNGNKHKVVISNNTFTIDGIDLPIGRGEINNSNEIYLFTWNNNGTPDSRRFVGRIYSFKIYKNKLVRDYIPCYRKSDNVIGLYDLVSNTFFTNAGTGEFTYGSTSLALSTPFGDKGIEDRTNDLSFTDFNNWESEQYDINENKDIEEIEQIKAPNILSDTYTSITADTEVQPNQVDFIPKAIDENKASEPSAKDWVENEDE